ncbi:hypothetical protein B0H11DRAFT_195968 [Mycena galericulata]|nr:hypothetical protein B0H11DRAFT_195968 [Mycena galericulata]
MLFALTFVLSSLFLPAACQSEGDGNGFQLDPLTTGTFALLCIFALAYGLLSVWNFVALLTSGGHRSPYALLVPTIIFFAWSNAAYLALVVLENIPFSDSLPVLLIPTINSLSNLFNDWAVVLLFLVVISVIWNRETVLRTTTDGKFGGHHPALIALHVALATLTFAFGTAAEAFNIDTNVQFYTTDNFGFGDGTLDHRIHVYQQLNYVYTSFAVLTAVDVIVSAVLLRRSWRKAVIPDKITNIVILAVAPIYGAFSLTLMIFTILFSPSGISNSASLSVFEGANLASVLLSGLFPIMIMVIILSMSSRKANWTAGGIEPPKPQYWRPQPEYIYAAPPQGPHAGYFVGAPAQVPHHAQPQQQQGSYAGSYTPGGEHLQYAPPESGPGSYTPGSPSMEARPGSYSPPQSTHSQPMLSPEKTGLLRRCAFPSSARWILCWRAGASTALCSGSATARVVCRVVHSWFWRAWAICSTRIRAWLFYTRFTIDGSQSRLVQPTAIFPGPTYSISGEVWAPPRLNLGKVFSKHCLTVTYGRVIKYTHNEIPGS